MRLVLLTFAFFAACITSVAAHPNVASLPSPPGLSTAAMVVKTTPLAGPADAGQRRPLQSSTEAVKVNLAPAPTRQVAQNPGRTPAAAKEAEGELSYGTLLAALALMVVIAVRRSKAGRP